MNTTEYAREIIRELDFTLASISPEEAEQLVQLILGARRIFMAGAGRSGLAVKAFAMRLMHMGLAAYVIGEMVTPAMTADDLLLIGSGSGATASLVTMAERAKKLGASLALVTILPVSAIARLADVTVRISAPTPKADGAARLSSVQPMGSLFEQSLLIFLDIIVLRLMETKSVNSSTMFERHANLE
jgi:6-phospho-3-hexuloisomerase